MEHVLIDASWSMDRYIEIISGYLARPGKKWVFRKTLEKISPFDEEPFEIYGASSLYDSFANLAMQLLKEETPGVLTVLTDGDDTASIFATRDSCRGYRYALEKAGWTLMFPIVNPFGTRIRNCC